MAHKKSINNTVENVLGRCGIPTVRTIDVYKRCLGAFDSVNGDFEQTVNNLSSPGLFGKRKNLKRSSISYYVSGISRMPATERSRLKNLSHASIIAKIVQQRSKK